MPPTRRSDSILRRLSLTIWGLFLALIVLLLGLGYLAMRAAADRLVPAIADHTVSLRAAGSQALFLQAEQSVHRLHEELLRRLAMADPQAASARFEHLFARSPDGLWRLRPQWLDPEHAPTLYLHAPATGPDDSTKLRAVVAYDLLREQGPALSPPFYSVYMDFVEDGLLVYSRGRNLAASATASYTNRDYPTMRGSDPRRNPARRLFWTPVYFDREANIWMASVIQPLDWQGRWVGTVGHDLSVQTLLQQGASQDQIGGLTVILSGSGDLIAHPQLQRRIAHAQGQLAIARLGDPDLAQALATVTAAGTEHGARRSPDGRLWVAWAKIQGPGWYQVYLLPQARIDRLLALGLLALLGIGILALLPALWWLRRQIARLIAQPLRRLTRAADEVSEGLTPNPLAMSGDDELSRLGQAFDEMVEELSAQRALQQAHAQALQTEIDERRDYMQRLQEERTRLHTLLQAMRQGIVFVDASHKDGRIITHDAYPLQDAKGQHIGRLWVQEDVTHDRQVAEQLTRLAEQDPLTRLLNRRRFEEDLDACCREAEQRPTEFALLFFDLDEFKYVNDTYGHRAGDALLTRIAQQVQLLIRAGDRLYRLGGDEFAVLMPQASVHEATQLADRLVRRISQIPLEVPDQTLRLTASLGIAHFPTHATGAQDLVAHADIAMYQAKHSGKNRWSIYRPDHDASRAMATRLGWNDRIAHALEHDLLRLHFQGIYRARDGHLEHLEALLRMEDPAHPGVLILPSEFILHAEKSGKILDIDRWVLRTAIALLGRHPHLPALAVNVSGRSLDDPDLPDFIVGQLKARHVAPQRLLVELTETAAVSDMGDAARFIAALRRAGCLICLDDFGAGFASFAYLKHLRADILKIDGMFIRDLPQDLDNQVFVRTIIDVARGMGIRTVAEFVEDGKTLLMLREMGVDMVQGYHLDRPKADHPALHPPPFRLEG
ncbi:bifunctional diguanylate cyclase/phosphodiesterase [Thermomonas hydrothermalis]|uniref:Diguanylate cyclase (GGDEF) domain-containing protein n=1 Tax=Thermomonas hydrothermalis TaxID=213588 RepID=A0A1M4VGL6_9GAMM|nr:EAL domain-containing protein [Thermomonas hydrothermalis]SHE67973.1 diguanylate cyclase (GGDEF) domain-containing protein [Thermomonas hydrothermalis]